MRKTRAQVSSSQALYTPFWLGTFRERGYAFSGRMARDLSLGITVKLSCSNETICPFGKLLTWAKQKDLVITNINGFYLAFLKFYFKDFPVGRDHEMGQHPSRTIVEIQEENSVSPLWSCKNFDYNGSLSVRPKQRGFVPPCAVFRITPETFPAQHGKLATALTH